MLLALIGAVLVALTAIYAWATVAFGIRFSNLTHRGILTHGPVCVQPPPGVSVEEPVLVDLDRAVPDDRQLDRRGRARPR